MGSSSLEYGTDDEPAQGGTKATATRYRSASKGAKVVILDELCATTGWHRDHARKALREALGPRRVQAPRKARPPTYGEDVMGALCDCLGLSHLGDDSRFATNATNAARVAHREQLTAALVAVLRTRGADEWFAALTGAGVPCGPINDVAQGMRFAEKLGLEPIVDVDGSAQVANPLRLSATPVSYRHRPPSLGADEQQILAWLDGAEGDHVDECADLGIEVR